MTQYPESTIYNLCEARDKPDKEGTMSMIPRGSEHGGLDSSPDSLSILIAFGPILPAMLLIYHKARAQVRAKHAHLIFA